MYQAWCETLSDSNILWSDVGQGLRANDHMRWQTAVTKPTQRLRGYLAANEGSELADGDKVQLGLHAAGVLILAFHYLSPASSFDTGGRAPSR